MHRSVLPAGLALSAVVILAACSGAVGAPASQPPAPSLPVPSGPASTPTPTPVVQPSSSPSPVGALTVDLETATGHHVSIEVLDDGHHVVAARSGHPGDGASVPFGAVEARNLDARTVELTWSDTPGDAALGLYVSESADVVLVIRPERPVGEAIAFDRVLVVGFDRPVDASTLRLGMQDGLDTAA